MKKHLLGCLFMFMICSDLLADDLPKNLRRSSAEILGTIEPKITNECVVQGFFDPYPSLSVTQEQREFRWRIRVPDGSKVNVLWTHEAIPKEGFPPQGSPMIPEDHPLPDAAGDLVIVVRANRAQKKTLEICLFPEFANEAPSLQSSFVSEAYWLPYWTGLQPTLINPDRQKATTWKPEGQQLLMKHYVEVDQVITGYAVWLEFSDE